MKNLEYKLSIDTAKALTGLKSLAKSAEDFDNTTKEITPDFLKTYEKEINKSLKAQNTLSLKLDKLSNDFNDNAKAIELANNALKSDAYTTSLKNVEAYKEEIKKLSSDLRALAKEQKSIDAEKDSGAFNVNVEKQEALKKAILERKAAIKSESKEFNEATKTRDNLLKKEVVLKAKIDDTAKAMDSEKANAQKLKNELQQLSDKSKVVAQEQQKMGDSFKQFALKAGAAMAGLFAVDKLVDFGKQSIEAFKQAEMGYKSFASSVKANGESMYNAMNAVNDIMKNGGITSGQAQEAITNYLRMGFDVKEAKEQILREMDLATERRQSHYKTAGEAVVVASQGYLQENSTNSDATGNSKNISKIYEDYAKSINKTAEQLTKLEKKEALISESRKGHIEVAGAAARATDSLAGAEAKLDIELTKTKETVGQALAPAYKLLLSILTSLVKFTRTVISSFKEFGVSIAHISGMTSAFFSLLKTRDLKAFNKEMRELAKIRAESVKQIEKEQNGAYFSGQDSKTKTAKKEVQKTAVEIEAEKRRTEENQLKIEKLGHEKSLIELKLSLDDKKIELEKFKKESIRILGDISNIDIKLKNIELDNTNKNLSASGLTEDIKQSLNLRKSEIEKEIAQVTADTKSKQEQVQNQGTSKSGSGAGVTKDDINRAKLSLSKQYLDNEYALFKESANREQQVLSNKFNNFEIDAKDYYAKLRDLAEEDFKHQEKLASNELAKAKATSTSNEAERIEKLAAVAKAENDLKLIQMQRTNTLASLTDEQKTYFAELDKYNAYLNIDKKANRESASIAIQKIEASTLLSQQKITNEERLKLEADFQNKLHKIEVDALNARKALAKDPKEVAQINAEIENLELDHSVAMKQISNDLYEEQMKAYTSAMSKVRDFGDEVINDLFNGGKNLSSIFDKASKDIMSNLLKQFIGYEDLFKDGGALSNVMKKITGTDTVQSPVSSVASAILPGASPGSTGAMTVSAGTVVIDSAGNALSPLTDELSSKFNGVFDSIGSSLTSLFGGLGSSLSSILGSIGGGGGSSLMSGLGGIFSSLMSFDVGADNLSRDMIAKVHKGERILTAKENKTASPLLDNPEKFIRNAVGGGSGQNITNNYNFSNPVDRRTSDQLAAKSAEAMMRAQRNR